MSRLLRALYQIIGGKQMLLRFFKKGEKYNAANYRPVSLTCICCKTLEHIIVSNINKHLANESILADCQHGFQSQRSCETQLVQFYHDMVSNLDGARDRGQKPTDVKSWTGGYCTKDIWHFGRYMPNFRKTRTLL